MMKPVLPLLPMLLLAACGQQQADTAESTVEILPASGFDGRVVATVEGQPIPEELLLAFLRIRGQTQASAEQQRAALSDLVDLVLLAEDARAKGLLARDSLRADLAVQRLSLIANQAVTSIDPISEADIQAEYDREVGRTGRQEYHLRHILLESREAAQSVIQRLEQGESFAELEAEFAKREGPSAAGDLGWVNLAQVPEGFAAALVDLEAGHHADQPVRSDYGWHIIRLEGVRDFQPPALEAVQEGIRSSLARRRLEQYLKELRNNADVDVALPGA